MNFLLADPGYHRLEDSWHPEVYRMAAVESMEAPETGPLNRCGTFGVIFCCKPQSWLKNGEKAVEMAEPGTLWNPTLYTAKPLIRVYGTGEIQVGDCTVSILEAEEYTDIDCEAEDACRGAFNCNGNIRLNEDSFPVLHPGKNGITFSGGIEKIEITPRWWML